MRYKRNEYFRYELEHPVSTIFKIIELDGKAVETKLGEGTIKDISPHGMKLLTNLDIQLDHVEKIKAEFQVFLNSEPFTINGYFAWQKRDIHGYSYGIEMEASTESEKRVVEELKKFSKGTAVIRKG